jgi:hypothetical protein
MSTVNERRRVQRALDRAGLDPVQEMFVWVLYDLHGVEATLKRIREMVAEKREKEARHEREKGGQIRIRQG